MPRRDSLWFHSGFRLLWAGDTISQAGNFIGQTVLPLLAATVLAATPGEMGLLTAAENAAFLLIGLPAGVWVDRVKRRPLMLRADFARAALLLTIPVAWWAGALTLAHLVVIALLVSVGTVFFDISYQSYLPSLVGREHLLEGNAKLQSSQSVAQVTGPGIAGGLVQLAGAANAVLATGLGYLASGLFLLRIRTPEPEPAPHDGSPLRAQIAEGLRFVFGNPTLRAITLCTATGNFAGTIVISMQVLFLTRDLRLSPSAVGLVLAAGGAGAVLGALTAGFWTRMIGQARAIWLVPLVTWPLQLLLPLSQPGWPVTLGVLGLAASGYGIIIYNVAQVSYRQAICPERLLGRMNATVRFVVWGTMPLGGLAGGALGELIGVRATVWTGCALMSVTMLPVLASPLRKMRDLPVSPPSPTTPDPAHPAPRTPPDPSASMPPAPR
ncbi:putative MFS family arabinose efflux permease [Amycolatopsis endophytica]|uniref:Putative MFS family arabinose efflux permease n=1 Tax=Amycolatopsis endophytica TaxID=860233 RepID=A0A853B5D1_9PSEU|nr:MFS transporter [Amycolatopsis endophytica]NYI90418.1 putative MFS family arabinose efflux permease [Amycolatopsis endophytica]